MERYFWNKEMRLRHPDDFRQVWSEGRSMAHQFFILWIRPNEGHQTRIGLVASRKIGTAVYRNLARRRMREACRKLYPDLQSGWDIILLLRPSLLSAKMLQIEEALRYVFHQARVILPQELDEQ